MSRGIGLAFIASFCCLSAIETHAALPQYYITDLGSLGDGGSDATGINNLGQVVGYAVTNSGGFPYATRAFLWSPWGTDGVPTNPKMKNLGDLDGLNTTSTSRSSYAYGINDLGQVVGQASISIGVSQYSHAFLWTSGAIDGASNNLEMKSLGTLGGFSSWAFDINNSGQAVGHSDATGVNRAFLWSPNGADGVSGNPQMKDLGTLGGFHSYAGGINSSGQVTGSAVAVNGDDRAFLWTSEGTDGPLSNPEMKDLGTLSGSSNGFALNDNGQVVGQAWSDEAGTWRAFLWSPNGIDGISTNPQMKDLGTLSGGSSVANAINNTGQVVGNADVSGSPYAHAFLWTQDCELVDLNNLIAPNSGWNLIQATDINDRGQIVGTGQNSGGQFRAFLLTPIPVPSPTQAPSIDLFPDPNTLHTLGMRMWIDTYAPQFSPDSQQFLLDNSTPEIIDANAFWKNAATTSGKSIQTITDSIDFILALTGGEGSFAKYVVMKLLPDDVYQPAKLADLGLKLVTNVDPTLFLFSANSYIWGKVVAPELLKLGQDPFDPDYQEPVVITGFPNFSGLPSDTALELALIESITSATSTSMYLEAVNIAYDRYCSALAMSDSISAGLQLESLLYYMNLYRDEIDEAATDLEIVRSMLADAGIGNTTYDPQILLDLQADVLANGLPVSAFELLADLGLSQTEIDQIIEDLLALNPQDYSGDLYGALADVNDALRGIPEPGSVTLLGLVGAAVIARRRKAR